MNDLLVVAQRAVKAAIDAGAEFADAYAVSGRSVDVGVENTSLRDSETIRDYGVGVRAFYHGGMGLSTSQSLEHGDVTECGRTAAQMARAAHPDPDFVALPEPLQAPEVDGMFDDAIAGLQVGQVVDWCRQAIEEAHAVDPQVRLEGGAALSVGTSALASSTGVALERSGTSVSISFQAVVFRDGQIGAYFEYDAARQMVDFVPAGVSRTATEQALRYLGGRSIGTKRLPLVLGPFAASDLLASVIGAASAESVQRNRSFLAGKQGEGIAPELLTITECPLVSGGLSSGGYDAEGVPKRQRDLIQNGVLTTYLHNSYTANKGGVENTAHAARGGYGGAVGVGVSNLQVATGERTEAELIADIDEGLYIAFGGLQPDGASGDISATVDFGFKIENGQLAYPVATTMIGTDVFEMLRHLEAVSSDYRYEPGIIAPSLLISDVQVASND
mgnify:CR=1 FL=1